MQSLISIHDVAPETLGRVRLIIDRLPVACREHLTLLVIPGKSWQIAELDQLRQWQALGYALAGHGWHHKIQRKRGIYHHLHSWLISRDAAEHLSLSRDQIVALLRRSHAWFIEQGLQPPDFYVPPAWAMGAVTGEDLAASPFRYFETGQGLYDAHSSRMVWLPLIGFEADTPVRRGALSLWNRFNASICSGRHPLRIGLHPYDLELLLRDDVLRYLAKVSGTRHYRDLFA